MQLEKINMDSITRIVLLDKEEDSWYRYKNEVKFLGITIWEEGFYWKAVSAEYIGKEVPKNHIFENGTIYLKPRVRIHLSDEHTHSIYFDTYEEAKNYYDRYDGFMFESMPNKD